MFWLPGRGVGRAEEGDTTQPETCKSCSLEMRPPGDSGLRRAASFFGSLDFSELHQPSISEATVGGSVARFWPGHAAWPLVQGGGVVYLYVICCYRLYRSCHHSCWSSEDPCGGG